jgi:chromosome segregation ATPase
MNISKDTARIAALETDFAIANEHLAASNTRIIALLTERDMLRAQVGDLKHGIEEVQELWSMKVGHLTAEHNALRAAWDAEKERRAAAYTALLAERDALRAAAVDTLRPVLDYNALLADHEALKTELAALKKQLAEHEAFTEIPLVTISSEVTAQDAPLALTGIPTLKPSGAVVHEQILTGIGGRS